MSLGVLSTVAAPIIGSLLGGNSDAENDHVDEIKNAMDNIDLNTSHQTQGIFSNEDAALTLSPNVPQQFIINNFYPDTEQVVVRKFNVSSKSANDITFTISSASDYYMLDTIHFAFQLTAVLQSNAFNVFTPSGENPSYSMRNYTQTRFHHQPLFWADFFRSITIKINGTNILTTPIGSLKAQMLAFLASYPKCFIGAGGYSKYYDFIENSFCRTVSPNTFVRDSAWQRTNAGTASYPTTWEFTVPLPLGMFQINSLLGPNTIFEIQIELDPNYRLYTLPCVIKAPSMHNNSVFTPMNNWGSYYHTLNTLNAYITTLPMQTPLKGILSAPVASQLQTYNFNMQYYSDKIQRVNITSTSLLRPSYNNAGIVTPPLFNFKTIDVTFNTTGPIPNYIVLIPEIKGQLGGYQSSSVIGASQPWSLWWPVMCTFGHYEINSITYDQHPVYQEITNTQQYFQLFKYRHERNGFLQSQQQMTQQIRNALPNLLTRNTLNHTTMTNYYYDAINGQNGIPDANAAALDFLNYYNDMGYQILSTRNICDLSQIQEPRGGNMRIRLHYLTWPSFSSPFDAVTSVDNPYIGGLLENINPQQYGFQPILDQMQIHLIGIHIYNVNYSPHTNTVKADVNAALPTIDGL